MFKPEVIEFDLVGAANGADARDIDIADVRVTAEASYVAVEIACEANGAKVAVPVLLSAAASRALAAELMAAADAVEPAAQD